MARKTLAQQMADIETKAREMSGHAFDDMALGRHANWEDTIAGVIPAPGTQAYADKYASPAIQAMLLGTGDFTPGGVTDTCGLCFNRFELQYPADQYKTIECGDTWELICDACDSNL